jgi:hypothetical protein
MEQPLLPPCRIHEIIADPQLTYQVSLYRVSSENRIIPVQLERFSYPFRL